MLKSRSFPPIFALLAVFAIVAAGRADTGRDLLSAEASVSSGQIPPGGNTEVTLTVELADNWHIQSHKPNEDHLMAAKLSLADHGDMFVLQDIRYPEPAQYNFAFSDKPVSVFENTFHITGTLAAANSAKPGTYAPTLELAYQACSKSACAAPAKTRQGLDIRVIGSRGPDEETKQPEDLQQMVTPGEERPESRAALPESGIFGHMASAGLAVSLVLVFLGGLGLNLTPCVYPVIPITISYFGAQSEGRTLRLFVLGLVYVLGMALTYSAIGTISALSGAFFGGLLSHPIVVGAIAAVFIFLALGMFGWYDFKLPDSWAARASGSRTGLFGALLMGLTMGVIAAPCIGPFVLGLVAYVAAVGDAFYGFLLFFFLALGLGFPYLFLAIFAGKIRQLPRSGLWMEGVKHIFGLVLLAMAVYFSAPLFPTLIRGYALPVFGLLACGYLLFFDRAGNSVAVFRRLKSGLAIGVAAVCIFSLIPQQNPKDNWPAFTEPAYKQALANNEKVIMVFHADWCLPCREMEKLTFSDPRVQEAMDDFRVFQIDLTSAENRQARQIAGDFDVKGVPALLIIDASGREADRIIGFVNADEMLRRLTDVQSE